LEKGKWKQRKKSTQLKDSPKKLGGKSQRRKIGREGRCRDNNNTSYEEKRGKDID